MTHKQDEQDEELKTITESLTKKLDQFEEENFIIGVNRIKAETNSAIMVGANNEPVELSAIDQLILEILPQVMMETFAKLNIESVKNSVGIGMFESMKKSSIQSVDKDKFDVSSLAPDMRIVAYAIMIGAMRVMSLDGTLVDDKSKKAIHEILSETLETIAGLGEESIIKIKADSAQDALEKSRAIRESLTRKGGNA